MEQFVYTWGRGEDGQLGCGDKNDRYVPTRMYSSFGPFSSSEDETEQNVKSTHEQSSQHLSEDTSASCKHVQKLNSNKVIKLACGSGHTVALTIDGTVYTWGRGDDGRLGHGELEQKSFPFPIYQFLKNKIKIQKINCGSYHSAAVTESGELYTWGGGMYGKLGHGNQEGCRVPCKVDGLDGYALGVACGSRHTLSIVAPFHNTKTTQVFAWGDASYGAIGLISNVNHVTAPTLISYFSKLEEEKVVKVKACAFHSLVLTDQGKLYSFGEGKFGRLGLGSETTKFEPERVSFPDDNEESYTRIKSMACGGFHSACVSVKGEMFVWGGNEHGQLGIVTK
eukprot:maker-scaffold_18-snap-gene-4.42-mRNA-1 protein AED:0.03 eAED:0.03 QI:72/1/1/1/1/0.66/3/1018/337